MLRNVCMKYINVLDSSVKNVESYCDLLLRIIRPKIGQDLGMKIPFYRFTFARECVFI